MSIEEEIKDRFLADTESILEDNLDELEGWFQFHQDGTINLAPEIRKLKARDQMLVYLIAKRYASEAGISDSPVIENDFFYDRLDKSESTIRNYQSDFRDLGLIRSAEQGIHEITVESLPESIEHIKSTLDNSSN
jgi:hypothetical protein